MANIVDEELKKMTEPQLRKAGIDDLGLFNGKKYCISDLEYIVKHTPVQHVFLLKTQYLTGEFCKEYLLNKKYIIHEVDDLTEEEIIDYQPHIKIDELLD